MQEGTFDDVVFLFGAIADGYTDSSAGELLAMKFGESATIGVASSLSSGLGQQNRLDTSGTLHADDTWYTASFEWTPTSGTTGDFTITVSDFSSTLLTLDTTGFTFDAATAQFGFGSVNDTIRFDNVSIVSDNAVVPEPASLALLGLGVSMCVRRRSCRG